LKSPITQFFSTQKPWGKKREEIMPFEAAASFAAISSHLSYELAQLYNRQQELEAEHASKIIEVNEKFLLNIGWSNDKFKVSENVSDAESIRARLLQT
jgi:hypothetical protein